MDADDTRDRQVWSLLLDDACRQVTEHLTAAGQPFLMLKGATIATWLYNEPASRTYSDLDVLIPPADQDQAVRLLGEIGYEPLLDAAALAVISPEEQPLQDRRGVTIDLHVAIKGINLAPKAAWDLLSAQSVTWDWAGTTVPALDLHTRTMHLGLHVAQRGMEDTKAVRDLELGLDRLPESTWLGAMEMARALVATEALSAGLHLLPRGADLARHLRLAPPSDAATLMTADASIFRPTAALERLMSAGSWAARVRTGWAYLFPSGAWLRHVDPRAASGAFGLAMARTHRPFRVAARLVSAARARRRFHRGRST